MCCFMYVFDLVCIILTLYSTKLTFLCTFVMILVLALSAERGFECVWLFLSLQTIWRVLFGCGTCRRWAWRLCWSRHQLYDVFSGTHATPGWHYVLATPSSISGLQEAVLLFRSLLKVISLVTKTIELSSSWSPKLNYIVLRYRKGAELQ